MRDLENISNLIQLAPDFLGLIFYPNSPRFIGTNQGLVDFFAQARSFQLVGVFVNASLDEISKMHQLWNLNYVQLHGSESPKFCEALKSRGLKMIKAFGIQSIEDFESTSSYASLVDYFLFDTKTPRYGGSGTQFDWLILDHYQGNTPFLLSGGIGPTDFPNISHPAYAGVDLNSRFEISPGLKNIPVLKSYFKEFRK